MDLSVSVCAGGVIFLDCAPRTAVRISNCLHLVSGGETAEIIAELRDIAGKIETASSAPVADSVAFRAANLIDRDAPDFHEAANQLTIGLSAAE